MATNLAVPGLPFGQACREVGFGKNRGEQSAEDVGRNAEAAEPAKEEVGNQADAAEFATEGAVWARTVAASRRRRTSATKRRPWSRRRRRAAWASIAASAGRWASATGRRAQSFDEIHSEHGAEEVGVRG